MKNVKADRKAAPEDIQDSNAEKSPIDFNDLLIDSVDEVVTEVLGVKVSAMLWRHYQAFLGITREEIPYQLPKLFESIETIFGTGEETVGTRVIRKLYAKANIPLEYSHSRSPVEYVEELKQILAKDPKQL